MKKFKTFLLFFLSFFLFFASDLMSREIQFVSSERHWAVTEEKFEIALERFRLGKKASRRTPVILSHGFLVNSRFMNLDKSHGLAEYLAQEGFDVWNMSFRGTGRSLNPLRGGPKRWTMDDIIDRDISAVIQYIQKETGRSKVSWVGYEMGGMLAYGYLEKKDKSGLAALVTIGAPATFDSSEQEPMKELLKMEESPTLKKIFLYLGGPFFERILIPLVPKIENFFYNPENIEQKVKERFLETALAPINPGVLDHVLVMIKQGEFVSAKEDFNYRKNLSKIRLPVLLIGGEKDKLAPPEAIRSVRRGICSKDLTLRIFGSGSKDSVSYGHFDLILGKKAKDEVFPVIGKWLKRRDRLK